MIPRTMHPPVRDFLMFLRTHPDIRARIAAPVDATVVYCGDGLRAPMWKEFEAHRHEPHLAGKRLLPEILDAIPTGRRDGETLKTWIDSFDGLQRYEDNGFIAWRAVSGLLARNAVGKVTFLIGDGISRQTKVFAANEVWVLGRNDRLDAASQQMVSFYKDCILARHERIGVSFLPA